MPRSIDDLYEQQRQAQEVHAAELAAIRRENHRMGVNLQRRFDAMAGEGLSPNEALLSMNVGAVNKLVESPDFKLEIGAGCESHTDFEGKWVVAMRSRLLNQRLKAGLACANIHSINEDGEDIDEKTQALFEQVMLHNALKHKKATPMVDLSHLATEGDPHVPDAKDAWDDMTNEEQKSFLRAFFSKNGPIINQLKKLINKSRTETLNASIKQLARQTGAVPFTGDEEADRDTYEEMKKPLDGIDKSWPRMCTLLCRRDAHGEHQFLHTPTKKTDDDDDDEPNDEDDDDEDASVEHPFSKFEAAVCAKFGIESPSKFLKAYLVWALDDIAKVEVPCRGHHKARNELTYGAMSDHEHWVSGINSALTFMQDRKRCPTTNPDVRNIQLRKAKKARK